MTTNTAARDVVNAILGLDDDSPIIALRNQKLTLVQEAQDYYDSLFSPTTASAAQFPLVDRHLVAVRVASHTGSSSVVAWHARLAEQEGADVGTIERATDWRTAWDDTTQLGAGIRHADLLVTSPDAAQPSDLEALASAGYSPGGIVALSQTIAFITYQVRIVAGLRALEQSLTSKGRTS